MGLLPPATFVINGLDIFPVTAFAITLGYFAKNPKSAVFVRPTLAIEEPPKAPLTYVDVGKVPCIGSGPLELGDEATKPMAEFGQQGEEFGL